MEDQKAEDEPAKEEKTEDQHTDAEIKQVYEAMCTGTIEQFLTGDQDFGSSIVEESKEQMLIQPMTSQQRLKCIEILSYIKRQNGLRQQRTEFQQQLRAT